MSNYLFANPSFLSGAARTLDLWGTFDTYNESLTKEQADYWGLYSDWLAVGKDMLSSMETYSLDCGQKEQG